MRKYFPPNKAKPHLRAQWCERATWVDHMGQDGDVALTLAIHESSDGSLVRCVDLTREQAVDLAKRILARAGIAPEAMEGEL